MPAAARLGYPAAMSRFFLSLAAAGLASAATAADPKTEARHTVARGETMSTIAEAAGVPATVIAEANGIREPYTVRAGQRLIIPRQRTHTVKAGETGTEIAERYGVPYSAFAIANGLDAKGTVALGRKLIVPAYVAPPTAAAAASSDAQAPARPWFRAPHDGKRQLGFAVRADGPNRFRGHDGIDFAAKPLDMVRAAASGTVSGISQADPRFGRLVTIDHGGGWKSAYGHLARITVKMGDVVKTGERIGLAGSSGKASGTELHFAIRRDGKPVDPAPLLAR